MWAIPVSRQVVSPASAAGTGKKGDGLPVTRIRGSQGLQSADRQARLSDVEGFTGEFREDGIARKMR